MPSFLSYLKTEIAWAKREYRRVVAEQKRQEKISGCADDGTIYGIYKYHAIITTLESAIFTYRKLEKSKKNK
jgi:hypothetical protein